MIRGAERVAWTLGVICLGIWAAARIAGTAGTRAELARFADLRAPAPFFQASPDQSLWSPERVRAWQDSQKQRAPAPLAVLRIPRLHLEVPVLEGTDELTLNRGVGHIEDTAAPGTDGNSGIAGHRDGFFRVLKDITTGDAMELELQRGVDVYRIERTWIVQPEDVSVLDPTATRSVTLVTCYPFYFIGSAPQRFIVRAEFVSSRGRVSSQ